MLPRARAASSGHCIVGVSRTTHERSAPSPLASPLLSSPLLSERPAAQHAARARALQLDVDAHTISIRRLASLAKPCGMGMRWDGMRFENGNIAIWESAEWNMGLEVGGASAAREPRPRHACAGKKRQRQVSRAHTSRRGEASVVERNCDCGSAREKVLQARAMATAAEIIKNAGNRQEWKMRETRGYSHDSRAVRMRE